MDELMTKNDFAIDIGVKETPIEGKLVSAVVTLDALAYESLNNDSEWREFMRKEITTKLVNYIIENGMVEITVQEDMLKMVYNIRAHMYLSPREQVKILRTEIR